MFSRFVGLFVGISALTACPSNLGLAERPYPCSRDAGTEQCASGWVCAHEGICRDPSVAEPILCANDSDCGGGWRCGVSLDAGLGTCHPREPGAWPCLQDGDCEGGDRCGAESACIPAEREAWTENLSGTLSVTPQSPSQLLRGADRIAISELQVPNDLNNTRGVLAVATQDSLKVIELLNGAVNPATPVRHYPLDQPITSMVATADRVYSTEEGVLRIRWVTDGGIQENPSFDHQLVGAAGVSDRPELTELIAVGDAGTLILSLDGGVREVPLNATLGAEPSALAILAPSTQLSTTTPFLVDAVVGITGNSLAVVQRTVDGEWVTAPPSWNQLRLQGRNCELFPAVDERLRALYPLPSGLLMVLTERTGGELMLHKLAPPLSGSCNAGTLTLGVRCSLSAGAFAPTRIASTPTEEIRIEYPEGASPRVRWIYGGPDLCNELPSSEADFPLTAMRPFTAPASMTFEARGTGHLLASRPGGPPPYLLTMDVAPLGAFHAGEATYFSGVREGGFGQRSQLWKADPVLGTVRASVQSSSADPLRMVRGEPSWMVNFQSHNGALIHEWKEGVLEPRAFLWEGFIVDPNQLSDAILAPRHGGGREIIIPHGDSLFAGPDEKGAVIQPRLVPSVHSRIRSVAALTPDAVNSTQPPLVAGYVLTDNGLFRFTATTEKRWRAEERELSWSGSDPLEVWAENSRGRVGFEDGSIFGPETDLRIAEPLPSATPVLDFEQLCGRPFALTRDMLYALVRVEGSPIARWEPVPEVVNALPRFEPEDLGSGLLRRLHSVENTLYVADQYGSVSTLKSDACP